MREGLEIHFKDFGGISRYRYVFIHNYAYMQHSNAERDPRTQLAYMPLIRTDCPLESCMICALGRLWTFFTLNNAILNACELDLFELDWGHRKC